MSVCVHPFAPKVAKSSALEHADSPLPPTAVLHLPVPLSSFYLVGLGRLPRLLCLYHLRTKGFHQGSRIFNCKPFVKDNATTLCDACNNSSRTAPKDVRQAVRFKHPRLGWCRTLMSRIEHTKSAFLVNGGQVFKTFRTRNS